MPDAAETARRRELQQRAFAPGGGLTDAEAAELRELDARHRAALGAQQAMSEDTDGTSTDATIQEEAPPIPEPEERSAPVGRAETGGFDAGGSDAGGSDGGDPSGAGEPDSQPHPSKERATRGRGWAVLAGIVVLVLGFAAGWLVFGRGVAATAMSAEQREIWVKLEGLNRYDPGSVDFVAEKHGVMVWRATQDSAADECVVLTLGEKEKARQCRPVTDERSLWDLQVSTGFEEDGKPVTVWALLTEDTNGSPVAVIQRHDESLTWDWRSQYSESELPIAEALVTAGYEGEGFQILGYDDQTPVWLYQMEKTCLIVADAQGITGEACDADVGPDDSVDLVLPDVIYSMHMSENRGPSLTIIRTGARTTIVTCDPDNGTCSVRDSATGG